jgi:hypothetical protein
MVKHDFKQLSDKYGIKVKGSAAASHNPQANASIEQLAKL